MYITITTGNKFTLLVGVTPFHLLSLPSQITFNNLAGVSHDTIAEEVRGQEGGLPLPGGVVKHCILANTREKEREREREKKIMVYQSQ